MAPSPLLVFDFDGVLVDGMTEYWWSARRAAQTLRPECQLPSVIPDGFRQLRPLIHKGWEMVLAALELSRSDLDLTNYLNAYADQLQPALERWQLSTTSLQNSLEAQRQQAIARVLTTKGAQFAAELLKAQGLQPQAVDGHEQGSKTDVLLRLSQREERELWFIEDRRPTLEAVRNTTGLKAVRCYLVRWGYLGPQDQENLPAGIALLQEETFRSPLSEWPA
jgi:phosphoglycolate phosphatase-like HAD superfamily hydrolase